MTANNRNSNRGLTLIEVLFVIVLIGLLMIPLAVQFRHVRVAWNTGNERSDLFQNVRIGFDKMIRELKAAKHIISVTASGNETGRIEFMDKDDNTAVFERFLNNGRYWLGYTIDGLPPSAENDILAGPVNLLRFICYAEDAETVTIDPARIKSVNIEMEMDSDKGGIAAEMFTGMVMIEREIVLAAGKPEELADTEDSPDSVSDWKKSIQVWETPESGNDAGR